MYSEADAERLCFILRAKETGFSLTDIAELLAIDLNKANVACADVKEVVDLKLMEIKDKIAALNHFKDSLQHLSDACCGGPRSAEHCSILEALESNSATGKKSDLTNHSSLHSQG